MRNLYPWEIERAKRAKPLPLDASWSTGDEDFDARIHASLMQRDELLAALKAVVEHFVGVGHHRDDCPGHLDHDGLTVLGPLCRDHQVAEMADTAISRAEDKQ